MRPTHFTQSETYRASLNANETINLKSGNLEAIGYVKKLPLGIKILYIPHGPVVTDQAAADFLAWVAAVKKSAAAQGCAFVRFDPQILDNNNFPTKDLHLAPKSAYRSFFIQPRFEWQSKVIPLEQLLPEFNQGTRRDYNLALKNNLHISFFSEFDEKAFGDFYWLLTQTATAQKFKPQTKDYTEKLVKSTLTLNTGFLAVVYQDQTPIAGALIITNHHTAFYVFGGLNYQNNLTGATIFMHSQIINHLASLGFAQYNFGSINHHGLYPKYSGITTFKQRFPGEVIDYGPLYDLIIKPVWYYTYTLIRWYRDFLNKLKKGF